MTISKKRPYNIRSSLMEFKMISIGDIASQINVFKTLAIALPKFYKKTKISAQFVLSYDIAQDGLNFSLGFIPRKATQKEYEMLFTEIKNAEKLITCDYVINNASNFQNIKQLIFKHKEETNQILYPKKGELKMITVGDIDSQLNIFKILAVALPKFYKSTEISAQFIFSYDAGQNGLNFSLGFTPREATEKEYEVLFEEIKNAEKLTIADYIINNASNFENIKQLIFKHKEEINQILYANKND